MRPDWASSRDRGPGPRAGAARHWRAPGTSRGWLFFQRVPEGTTAKNRVHLDVRGGTGLVGEERLAALEAECARLLPLGAVRERLLYDGKDSCIVMRDVEGNEFCLG
ncbi:VOC family protein [Streptomyces olivaceus]